MKEFLGDQYDQLNTMTNSLEEIAGSEALQLIEASWSTGSFAPCLKFCSEPFDTRSRMTTDDKIMINLKRERNKNV
jgi:hypothetical protein